MKRVVEASSAMCSQFNRFINLGVSLKRIINHRASTMDLWDRGRKFCTFTKESDPYPLTKQEAIYYIENILQIPNCENLVKADPLAFLSRLSFQTKSRIPFSNIPYVLNGNVQGLSLTQSKEAMMTRLGGNCCLINPFTAAVLDQLGLKTESVPASAHYLGGPGLISHVGIIIEDLTTTGSRHLFDPGNHLPLYEPIPLKFENSTPAQHKYLMHLKCFKASKDVVQICRRVGLDSVEKFKTPWPQQYQFEDGHLWQVLFIYNLHSQKGPSYFAAVSKRFAEDLVLGATVHSDVILMGFPDGLMVDINSKRCLQMDEEGNKKVTKINNKQELMTAISKYFPQYPVGRVEDAINMFVKFPSQL